MPNSTLPVPTAIPATSEDYLLVSTSIYVIIRNFANRSLAVKPVIRVAELETPICLRFLHHAPVSRRPGAGCAIWILSKVEYILCVDARFFQWKWFVENAVFVNARDRRAAVLFLRRYAPLFAASPQRCRACHVGGTLRLFTTLSSQQAR